MTALAAGLEHDEEANVVRAQALRGFLDKIVIPEGDGLLQVVGNWGMMLDAAATDAGRQAVAYVGCGGSQPTLSAALATGGVSQRPTLSKRARSTTPTSLRF